MSDALGAMLAVTQHRANNGQKTFVDPTAGIALAYCHTATFGQREDLPSWYEDDESIAGVDGDIYQEASPLNDRLMAGQGPHARAAVATYLASPRGFPAGLDGVFSLFLWDRKQKTLHLSADPLGHKLVYYYEDPAAGLLVFSTELKAVLAHPSVPRRFEDRFLPLYLTTGITAPPFTLIKDVRKLRPVECLPYSPNESRSNRYWRPTLETGPDEFDFWVGRTRSELVQAVKRTIGGSEKVAVYLSGGLDSSVVLAALKQCDVREVRAFTLAFEGDTETSDVRWAERIASVTGTRHQICRVDSEVHVTPDLISTLLAQIDDPFESASRIASEYFLGQATSDAGFDSVLTGAMPNFSLRRVRNLRAADPAFESSSLRQSLGASFRTPIYMTEERMNRALVGPADLSVLDEAALTNWEVLRGLDQARTIQLDWQLRSASGRDSAYYQCIPRLFGLEERTPYLDTHFAALALSVPPAFKGLESAEFERVPLREAFRDVLEVDFREHQKQAFPSAPLPSWLSRILVPSLKPLVDEGIVTAKYLTWLEENAQQGRKRARREAWQWFIFNCWYQLHIKQKNPLEGVA